jgi:hypothetical protein
MSGWGKSYHLQATVEANAENYDILPVLDYKDEYRGLVKAGLLKWWIVGPREASWSRSDWRRFLTANPKVVLARHRLDDEDWKETCGRIIGAARELAGGSTPALVVVEEAHWVAPQGGSVPDATTGLATTGRGEGASSIWSTQRPATLEKTVLTQADETFVGGFMQQQDRDAIEAEYPTDVHNPQLTTVPGLPDDLHADDGPVPLRRFTEGSGDDERTVGSEWITANDKGEMKRVSTRGLSMQSTHYGPEGHAIANPDYS